MESGHFALTAPSLSGESRSGGTAAGEDEEGRRRTGGGRRESTASAFRAERSAGAEAVLNSGRGVGSPCPPGERKQKRVTG